MVSRKFHAVKFHKIKTHISEIRYLIEACT